MSQEFRDLIRMMSRNNPCWRVPRIHGELLKLGIEITEPTVAKYMVRSRKTPSQNWRTFLTSHVKSMVSVYFFVVPTVRVQVLYVFLVLAHDRGCIVHMGATAHPTAEWTAYSFARPFRGTVHLVICWGTGTGSMPRAPWQRAYVERLIGSS